jgi:HSP20 family molecular chaperone IbpA
MARKVELAHNWNAEHWDWPLQHRDGVVRVHDSPHHFEVGLDCVSFTPNEIDVSILDGHLIVYCKHEARGDRHGSVSRELSRSYKLPDGVDEGSVKSHLDSHGILHISGVKRAGN